MDKDVKKYKPTEAKAPAKTNKTTAKTPTVELPVTQGLQSQPAPKTATTIPEPIPVKTVQPQPEKSAPVTVADTIPARRAAEKPAQYIPTQNGAGAQTAFTVDSSVFSDTDDDAISEPLYDYRDVSRSKTIDGTLLSSERVKAAKRKRKKQPVSAEIELADRFNPDVNYGLTTAQVESRFERGYVNVTRKKSGRSYASIILSNFFTFFNMLTFIVAIALIIVRAKPTQLFFLGIILTNIFVGIFFEIKSKRAVDKLSIMTAPTATVVRNGEKQVIPISEVVLDDIMFLEMGKQICADGVVIKGDIEVNESLLTGESDAIRKTAGSELFSGSFVTSGNCFARVDKVGSANYVEKLASHAKKYQKPRSELNRSIRLFIMIVSIFIVPISIFMVYNNYRNFAPTLGYGWDAWQQNIISVSGAIIGMIPAGMFLLTSTALAFSVIRLSKKRTLVQDLYCIEMLARVDVLCLDKTGTITDGTMQVNNIIEIKGGESQYSLNNVIGSILTATGDNNQTAMALANRFGYSQALRPTQVLPFSSQRKLSAVTFEGAGTYMLGAPEFVLRDVGVRIEKIINDNAANGFRVLCLAHSPSEIVGGKLPAVRRPLCLIVVEDHIRDDAIETIRWFRENNVAVKVISGDNPLTVSEVARRVGVERAELFISLDGLSNQEVIEAANKYTVFGRVSPQQKLLIIQSLKAKGHTVAMTGDGVNDILAMREADCSVSIASGSEAARNVSHLVLQDSSFTSMPDVVREGRRVVNNIQKSASLFLMKTFMSILLSLIFMIVPSVESAVFIKYPYTTDNLLLLELVIIGLPSFVLAFQSNTNLIKGKFLSNVIGRCVPGAVTLVVVTMAVYFYNSYAIPHTYAADGTISYTLYTSMLTMTLVYTGLILLAKTCEPFDMVRTVLIIVIVLLILLAVNFSRETWFGINKSSLSLQEWLYMATVVLGAYFFASILIRIMKAMKVLN